MSPAVVTVPELVAGVMDRFDAVVPSYAKPGDVARHYDISPSQLQRWGDNGWIPFVRSEGGHRRYPLPLPEVINGVPRGPRRPLVEIRHLPFGTLYERPDAERTKGRRGYGDARNKTLVYVVEKNP